MQIDESRRFKVVFEPDEGGFHVFIPEVQGCRTWAPTIEEGRVRIREALVAALDDGSPMSMAVATATPFEEEVLSAKR